MNVLLSGELQRAVDVTCSSVKSKGVCDPEIGVGA